MRCSATILDITIPPGVHQTRLCQRDAIWFEGCGTHNRAVCDQHRQPEHWHRIPNRDYINTYGQTA